jgi:tetratricopeptide (TPR) repeat protein
MQQHHYLWLGLGVALAACLAAALFFFGPRAAMAPTTPHTASTTTTTIGNVTVTLPAGAVVKEVPYSAGTVVPPSLDHQVVYSPNLAPDVLAILKADIASTTRLLKTDPSQAGAWYQLAIYYKIAGDYSAAESVWVYLTQEYPHDYVAFGDLGDLYQNFLKEYSKAAADYKAAIARKPDVVDYYNSLYLLYRYDLNDMADAKAIVAAGLKANPGDPTLTSLESQLQAGQ